MQVANPSFHLHATPALAPGHAAAPSAPPQADSLAPAVSATPSPAVQKDDYTPSARRASSLTLTGVKPAADSQQAGVQALGQDGQKDLGASSEHQGSEAAREPGRVTRGAPVSEEAGKQTADTPGSAAAFARDTCALGAGASAALKAA